MAKDPQSSAASGSNRSDTATDESFFSPGQRLNSQAHSPRNSAVSPDETDTKTGLRPEPSAEPETAAAGMSGVDKADAETPSIELLDEDSDYSVFFSPKVREEVRRAALRRLFQMPKFNLRDGLDDYDEDYHLFETLGNVITADMRHQIKRLAGKTKNFLREDTPDGKIPAQETTGISPPAARSKVQPQSPQMDVDGISAQQGASYVTFHSAGNLLIIGDRERAMPLAKVLDDRLTAIVLIDPSSSASEGKADDSDRSLNNITVARGKLVRLTGHLGQFTAIVSTREKEINLAQLLGAEQKHIDLVLDLTVSAYLRRDVLPPGYYAPGSDPHALKTALAEIPELIGEFEKPRFVCYNPKACVHGSCGLHGCMQCIDACCALAITSQGDRIEVNHHLCQDCGSCVTACPTGAMNFADPIVPDLLDSIQSLLKRYRQADGQNPGLVFHDKEAAAVFRRIASRITEPVLPVQIEALGSVGMDIWLAALACGASHVFLLAASSTAPAVLRVITTQLSHASAILEGMGYSGRRVQLILADDDGKQGIISTIKSPPAEPQQGMAISAVFVEKRPTIFKAVEHLYAQAPAPRPVAVLPEGAPFGEIDVAKNACTLCMACVAVCKASALCVGSDRPKLGFIEADCVQCGLCRTVCPEDAIRLSPRFVYDRELQNTMRILNEDAPFNCITCGKPFATRMTMEKIEEKLAGHWMFQNDGALRRLRMCETCRVQDIFDSPGGIEVHKKPKVSA